MTKKQETPLEMEPVVESALKAVDPAESDDPGLNEAKKPGLGKRLGKLVGQRATDVSLLTANSNQLRLMMHYNKHSSTYMICISLIIISLIVQKLVAAGSLAVKSRPKNKRNVHLKRVKVATSIGAAIITGINLLIASLVSTGSKNASNKNETIAEQKNDNLLNMLT
ncbi:hypothetical protein quinque_009939 [Culex quinquefasciatus]